MRRLLIVLVTATLFLTACNTQKGTSSGSNPNSSGSSASNSSNGESSSESSGVGEPESSNGGDNSEESSYVNEPDDSQGDPTQKPSGKLSVSTSVSRPRPDANEIRPGSDTADKLNPEIAKAGGAGAQAQAMRDAIVKAGDNLKVSGTTYYVSPAGSDDNDGKTPAAAFATISGAFSSAKAGDAVLLERGAVFRLSSGVTLVNGVSYGAFGTGAKPEIWGSPENYAQASRWSPHNIKNVWKMEFPRTDVGIMVFDHGALAGEMQSYIRNLTRTGDYFFDDVQKVLYLYCDKGNPGTVYQDIEIGSRAILFRLRDGAQNVTIDNISFKYTGTFAIRGSMGCRNITITNCEIGWVGGSLFEDGSNRYGNGIEFTAGCQNIRVENCWIYQVYDAGFTFQITLGAEDDEVYSTFKNITFRNNLVEYCSWAFEWWPSSKDSITENISVTGNIMRFSGYGWARDTRSPSHIRGSWSAQPFQTVNFTMTANIFDCANGPIYAWPWANPTQPGHTMSGNSYYQRLAPFSKGCTVFKIGYGDAVTYASNQKELETAIRLVDAQSKEIKWLG